MSAQTFSHISITLQPVPGALTYISSAITVCLEIGLRFLFITLKDSFMVCFFHSVMILPGLHVKLLCNPIKLGMTLSHFLERGVSSCSQNLLRN